MSNKEIGDIYKSVRGGEQYQPKASLKDMYSKVNPSILEEAHMVEITDDAGNVVYKAAMPDEMVGGIKKQLERAQKVQVGGKSYTAYDIVDQCLEIDGWKKGNSMYTSQVLNPVKAIFDSVDINREAFGNLIELQTDKDNPLRNVLLTNPGRQYNYLTDLISPKVFELFPTQEDAYAVINGIWDITTTIANAGVGKGEVVMTLFSDAIKGQHGDLHMPGGVGEVEIKGTGARVGGGTRAHDRAAEELEAILKSRKVKIHPFMLQQLKDEILQSLQNMSGQAPDSARHQWRLGMEQLFSDISSDMDYDSILKSIAESDVITKTFKKEIENKITKYRNRSEGNMGKPGMPKGSFATAISVFFREQWTLTSMEILNGLLACRGWPSDGILNDLKLHLSEILKSVDVLDNFDNRGPLARVIAALHTVAYQAEEKFDYLVLANDNTKQCLAMHFDAKTSVSDTLVRVFNMFNEHDVVINLSIDGTRSTTGLTLGNK